MKPSKTSRSILKLRTTIELEGKMKSFFQNTKYEIS